MGKIRYILIALAVIPLTLLSEKTTIYLEHSNTLTFDQNRLPDCQILKGDVQFRHDNANMFCDSAYFYSKSNTLNAFSNVRIIQGDSIFIYGDKLHYDGNTKLARLRNNVRMENKNATLYTDSLNYDRAANVGYYFNHGKIVDSTNELTSVNGHYYPDSDRAVFQKKVVLTNDDLELNSDTLIYNTKTHIANIVGPSRIYFDDAWIYSESGWYDTDKDNSELLNYSIIRDYEGHTLTADTLHYDRAAGVAEGFNNVFMKDSVDNLIIKGGYGYYNEKIDSAYVIKRATAISFDSEDADSIYVSADTLFYMSKDSAKVVKGYYNVQTWSADFQGITDSIFYSTTDSIARMFGTPVTWQGKNQATGDSILIYTRNNKVDKIEAIGSGFLFMKNDTAIYNQISGKKITCYVDSNRLKKIYVDGNALSVYFAEEEPDSASTEPKSPDEYVGINVSESSEMTIYIDAKNRPERVILTPASSGVMYTPDKRGNKDITILKGLLDCYAIRPISKYDIYNIKDRTKLREVAESKPKHKRKKR